MADTRNCSQDTEFKEAVCIDAGRVYDSCCDRDCLEDLRCYFSTPNQTLIADALSVRLRSAEILNTYINVEPVSFNRGYYACDLTFFFLLSFDVYTAPGSCQSGINAVAHYTKRVILYGSDGNVKVFSNTISTSCSSACETNEVRNYPRCVVQAVDPVPLSSTVREVTEPFQFPVCVPDNLDELIGGEPASDLPEGTPAVFVSLGLFTVVQLIRNVQMLVPVYDFCIPEKSGSCETDGPCDAFRKLKFPTDDFFPPKTENTGCGCNNTDN